LRQNSNSLAPFIPTPYYVVRKKLELAQIKDGEILFDLGSGDGRIVLMAAKEFGAKGVGIEHKLSLIEESRDKILELGITKSVIFIHDNIFKANLESADVVTLYLTTRSNERIRVKLENELKKGARVVTHNFPMIRWNPNNIIKIKEGNQTHTLYLYKWNPETKKI